VSRRGNGLSADAYAPLIDLAPELADAMLTALGEVGIAAYAAGDEAVPEAEAPETGLERLYVDASRTPAAEDILHTHLARLQDQRRSTSPGAPAEGDAGPAAPEAGAATAERDEDTIWAEIVAGFDAEPEDGATPWPEEENLGGGPGDQEDGTGRLPTARVIKHPGSEIEPPDFDAEDDDDDHYVPPPPPPLPSGDPITRGAWLALVGGPLYLLLTVILGWEVPGWAAFVAVAAFIGGFVALVLRMGDEPRDPDDGAVI
jgi:hypothetical protein